MVLSLEAALWAFQHTDDFQSAVLRAVNLGDDADSTGADCGQLAGACYGVEGISADLLTGLAKQELIENAFARLLETAD